MQELFNQIDQGLYDHVIFIIAIIAALIVAIPVRREEREDGRKDDQMPLPGPEA